MGWRNAKCEIRNVNAFWLALFFLETQRIDISRKCFLFTSGFTF